MRKIIPLLMLVVLTGCPKPPPPVIPDGNIVEQIDALHDVYRAQEGLPPLERLPALDVIAWEHSRSMVNQPVNHWGISERCQRAQLIVATNRCGENAAKYQTSASQVMNAWMNSGGHRRNILNGNFRYIGVGVEGTSYTVIFK